MIPSPTYNQQKVIIITGASQGIGWATTKLLASHGYKVYATTRPSSDKNKLQLLQQQYPSQIVIKNIDVTQVDTITNTIDDIIDTEGRIDVLINNAGYAIMGPIETITIEEAQAQFNTNVFGVIRMLHATIPHMRARNQGHIINISSTSGVDATPGLPLYASSKHALEGLSEALAADMSLWGIKVSIIEPGPTRTNITISRGTRLSDNEFYNNYQNLYYQHLRSKINSSQNLDEVAAVIHSVIEEEHPHLRYQTNDHVRQRIGNKLCDVTGDERLKQRIEELNDILAEVAVL